MEQRQRMRGRDGACQERTKSTPGLARKGGLRTGGLEASPAEQQTPEGAVDICALGSDAAS